MDNLVYSLFDYFDKMPFIISYIAGLLSFLSPCVLPLVPIYFFYIAGISAKELENKVLSKKEKIKIFIESLLFVLGFSIVFILIGVASAKLIGNIFAYKWVNILTGIIIIIFGIHLGGFYRFKFLNKEKRLHLENVGSFMLGFSFAFGWTPCIGPIFGTIVGIAASEPERAIFMMILYTLGLATPFILMALFSVISLKLIEKMKKYLGIIEKISGGLLIVVGLYFVFKLLNFN
ncbi:cytochrome c biogenesis CcdA family protein [Caminibacter mediatlanticus]|uniref:Cytochrome c biogenesis protein (Ccda) n=1 Tax=Caminibacter mediatlanticus TB-2 TaxID=391592 RepID=A0AAI9AHY4_9BACT|nr:cytochrome c biogenesis protein CcdA [Caminibacter mediatlanticus]EDM23993.1 cytochrome c biogenesis protein (ccda) [Caminibacter mediatlanticus TB-2]